METNVNGKFDQMLSLVYKQKQEELQNNEKRPIVQQWAWLANSELEQLREDFIKGYIEDGDFVDEYQTMLIHITHGTNFNALGLNKEEAMSFLRSYATYTIMANGSNLVFQKLQKMCSDLSEGKQSESSEK